MHPIKGVLYLGFRGGSSEKRKRGNLVQSGEHVGNEALGHIGHGVKRLKKEQKTRMKERSTSKRFQEANISTTVSNIQKKDIRYEYIIRSIKDADESAATLCSRTQFSKSLNMSLTAVFRINRPLDHTTVSQICKLKSSALTPSSIHQSRLPFIFHILKWITS